MTDKLLDRGDPPKWPPKIQNSDQVVPSKSIIGALKYSAYIDPYNLIPSKNTKESVIPISESKYHIYIRILS